MSFEILVLYIVNELYFRRLPQTGGVLDVARGTAARQTRSADERFPAMRQRLRPIPSLSSISGCVAATRAPGRKKSLRRWSRRCRSTFAEPRTSISRRSWGSCADRNDGARVPAGVPSSVIDCATSRKPPWKAGCRSTGATSVALTDVVGMDAFLRDFDLYFATALFDGLRHDSGDPIEWGEKAIAHYSHTLRIDPTTKRLVFSDALNSAGTGAVPSFPGADSDEFRDRDRSHERYAAQGAQHRHEDHRVQRPAGGKALRRAGQDPVRRRNLPGLPAPGFSASALRYAHELRLPRHSCADQSDDR